RSGEHAERFLHGFRGRFLQCDGYEGYDRLKRIERPHGPGVLVHCWSHLRRRFVKLVRSTKSPTAEAAVRQIAALYAVDATVRGASPAVRLAARRGAFRADRRRLETVVRKTAIDNLLRLQTCRRHTVRPRALGRAHPLPRRRP